MKIVKYNEFITEPLLEKSIGSEEIRNKWYSDLPKDIFYKLVNIDISKKKRVF